MGTRGTPIWLFPQTLTYSSHLPLAQSRPLLWGRSCSTRRPHAGNLPAWPAGYGQTCLASLQSRSERGTGSEQAPASSPRVRPQPFMNTRIWHQGDGGTHTRRHTHTGRCVRGLPRLENLTASRKGAAWRPGLHPQPHLARPRVQPRSFYLGDWPGVFLLFLLQTTRHLVLCVLLICITMTPTSGRGVSGSGLCQAPSRFRCTHIRPCLSSARPS